MAKSNYIVRGGADFSGLYQEFNKAQKKMNGFKSGMTKALKGAAAIFGTVKLGQIVKDSIKTAARTETLGVAMNSVAKASGYATSALNQHKKAVMEMGIAEQESMQILTRFMQAQLDTADASKLARVAQDAAVIANTNSSQAAEQMTEAIAKQRPILLAQFGMMASLDDMYKAYADSVGKAASQLTKTEKQQAMLNYILKEGEKIAGTYEASMGSAGKQIGSLPRYWQTLQNAVATPLALPGLSVAVDAITNSLKSAIAWADANAETLKRWGQTVANAVGGAIKAFGFFGRALANNWPIIKSVGLAIVVYTAATKAATAATAVWKTTTALLNGSLKTGIPLLSTLSVAIGTYRLQMALAPVATDIFTGALIKLRAAIYAVNTALGPVGWAIIAMSGLITVGTSLWGKYTKSLNQFNASSFEQVGSSKKAKKAIEKQAEAIKAAGKAAKGSVAGFDEINQLQDAAATGDIGDVFDEIPEIPEIGGIPGLDFDMGEILAEVEAAKPTLKGFGGWIKSYIKDEWVDPVASFYSGLWKDIKTGWNEFTTWVSGWTIWGWLGGKFEWIGAKASLVWNDPKQAWNEFTTWVGNWKMWGWLGEKSDWVGKKASKLWEPVQIKWNEFTTWVGNWKMWGWLDEKMDWTKKKASLVWNDPKQAWNEFTTWVSGWKMWTWLGEKSDWVSEKMSAGASGAWKNIKNTFANIPDWFKTKFTEAWTNVKNVFSTGGKIFTGIKEGIAETFKTVVNGLIGGINTIISAPFKSINSMLNKIRNASVLGVTPFAKLWGENPLSIPQIPKLAKGGITDGPMLAMIGDNPGGREVVSPLEDLTNIIASAVGTAVMNAIQFTNTGSDGEREVILSIDGTKLGRAILPKLNQESERLGYKTILQTT